MPRYRVDCQLTYDIAALPADFIFTFEVAERMGQTIRHEALTLSSCGTLDRYTDPATGNRFLRVAAQPGRLTLSYLAEVEKTGNRPPAGEPEIRVNALPLDVVPYIFPSRYCESDALTGLAGRLFGQVKPGHARVEAIVAWVRGNVDYQVGMTTSLTTARDVLMNRVGVCRDFAHVCIAFCRALNIPARIVTGYSHFDTPPPDFHAIFEAYLGNRWILFDPTEMAPLEDFIRIGTASDAADVAFATLFGPIRMVSLVPEVTRLATAAQALAA